MRTKRKTRSAPSFGPSNHVKVAGSTSTLTVSGPSENSLRAHAGLLRRLMPIKVADRLKRHECWRQLARELPLITSPGANNSLLLSQLHTNRRVVTTAVLLSEWLELTIFAAGIYPKRELIPKGAVYIMDGNSIFALLSLHNCRVGRLAWTPGW